MNISFGFSIVLSFGTIELLSKQIFGMNLLRALDDDQKLKAIEEWQVPSFCCQKSLSRVEIRDRQLNVLPM